MFADDLTSSGNLYNIPGYFHVSRKIPNKFLGAVLSQFYSYLKSFDPFDMVNRWNHDRNLPSNPRGESQIAELQKLYVSSDKIIIVWKWLCTRYGRYKTDISSVSRTIWSPWCNQYTNVWSQPPNYWINTTRRVSDHQMIVYGMKWSLGDIRSELNISLIYHFYVEYNMSAIRKSFRSCAIDSTFISTRLTNVVLSRTYLLKRFVHEKSEKWTTSAHKDYSWL